MTDREKIISAIEKAKKQSEDNAQDRIIVPFKEADMILELLKEQEPVKPRHTPPKSIYSWECGVCAEPFDRIANYCPKCGREVEWDA